MLRRLPLFFMLTRHGRPYGRPAVRPVLHLACDTFANVALDVLDLNSDAVAFSTLTYAMDTGSVNGR